MNKSDVNIIIPVRGALDYLESCLESIKRFTAIPYDITLINDGNTGDAGRRIDSLAASVRAGVCSDIGRLGFPKSCNRGMLATKSKYICLLNTDTLVSPGWDGIFDVFQDKTIGIAGPSTSHGASEQTHNWIRDNRDSYSIGDMPELAKYFKKKYTGIFEDIDLVVGFCFCFPTELISYIGYFDDRFGLGSGEERDYCRRARKMGFRTVYAKEFYVHHFGKKSFMEEMTREQIEKQWTINRDVLNVKWSRFDSPIKIPVTGDKIVVQYYQLNDGSPAVKLECKGRLNPYVFRRDNKWTSKINSEQFPNREIKTWKDAEAFVKDMILGVRAVITERTHKIEGKPLDKEIRV